MTFTSEGCLNVTVTIMKNGLGEQELSICQLETYSHPITLIEEAAAFISFHPILYVVVYVA